MENLWAGNEPARFWQCEDDGCGVDGGAAGDWARAVQGAAPLLGLERTPGDVDRLLALTLGEGRLGSDRWRLSPAKHAYYLLKPLLPRALTRLLRRLYSPSLPADGGSAAHPHEKSRLGWPAELRYARFQWDVMRRLAAIRGRESLSFTHFWPNGKRFALVLTHDVETAEGQDFVRQVADLDESLGFRSSFNFVPERYPLDRDLLDELRGRGFEIGVHGLKHDGRLFRSRTEFLRRARRINHYLRELGAVGFRAPLTHRHGAWMQALDIEYDLSFFDTDPYEPMPGGTMSLWPFLLGRFVELPYTLVQDYVLTAVLGQKTPRIWLEKVDVIEQYHGMALLNSHPDYMRDGSGTGSLAVYRDFLREIKGRDGYWHALPRDVARWWRARLQGDAGAGLGTLLGAVPARATFHAGVRDGDGGPQIGIDEVPSSPMVTPYPGADPGRVRAPEAAAVHRSFDMETSS